MQKILATIKWKDDQSEQEVRAVIGEYDPNIEDVDGWTMKSFTTLIQKKMLNLLWQERKMNLKYLTLQKI